MDDVLYTADGRRIGRLDPVFKTGIPIREAQIVQESLERVRVVYVPAPGYTDAIGQTIAERLRDRMGDIDVVLEESDALPRTSNGKFRAVISHVRPDDIPHGAP
jgi:phenylacetate-CoA ligase